MNLVIIEIRKKRGGSGVPPPCLLHLLFIFFFLSSFPLPYSAQHLLLRSLRFSLYSIKTEGGWVPKDEENVIEKAGVKEKSDYKEEEGVVKGACPPFPTFKVGFFIKIKVEKYFLR